MFLSRLLALLRFGPRRRDLGLDGQETYHPPFYYVVYNGQLRRARAPQSGVRYSYIAVTDAEKSLAHYLTEVSQQILHERIEEGRSEKRVVIAAQANALAKAKAKARALAKVAVKPKAKAKAKTLAKVAVKPKAMPMRKK